MWVIFLIVGVVLSIVTLASIIKGKKSKNWPSTAANVVSTEVEVRRDYDEDGEKIYYYPRVYYDYKVNDRVYRGSRYKLLEQSMSKRKAHTFISNFAQGDRITIFYDPDKPEESVMQPGEQIYLYFFFVLGIALVCYSLNSTA